MKLHLEIDDLRMVIVEGLKSLNKAGKLGDYQDIEFSVTPTGATLEEKINFTYDNIECYVPLED